MHAIFDSRGHESNDALVPVLIEQAQTERETFAFQQQRLDGGERLVLHAGFELATVPIELRESRCKEPRSIRIVGQQALDSDRHVVEPASRVETRPDLVGQVRCNDIANRSSGAFDERPDTRQTTPCTNPAQPLVHQNAIVAIERHEIGNRSERNEIEQVCNGGRSLAESARVDFPGQRSKQIERDTHASEGLAGKGIALDIGIHDCRRGWQLRGRQVVVGDQRIDAQRVRRGHARMARDTVVDRQNHGGALLRRKPDDLGCKPVAVLEPIGDDETQIGESKSCKLSHDERSAGRAVGIEVADHDDAAAVEAPSTQQLDGIMQSAKVPNRNHLVERERQVLRVADTTGRVDTAQYGVQRRRQAVGCDR